MKSLYACIEINRKINEIENIVTERVKYYKTKDELYGIQIVKDNDLQNKEEKVNSIEQITEDENEIFTTDKVVIEQLKLHDNKMTTHEEFLSICDNCEDSER